MDKGRGGSQKEPTGVEQRVAEKQSTGQGPLPGAVGMCKPSSLKTAEWGKEGRASERSPGQCEL